MKKIVCFPLFLLILISCEKTPKYNSSELNPLLEKHSILKKENTQQNCCRLRMEKELLKMCILRETGISEKLAGIL